MSGAAGTFFSRVLSRFQPSRVDIFTDKGRETKTAKQEAPPALTAAVASPALPEVVPVSPRNRRRAITSATNAPALPSTPQTARTGTPETRDPVRDSVLLTLEQDLLALLNQTSCVLVRVKRTPSVPGMDGVGAMRGRAPAIERRETPRKPEKPPAEGLVRSPFGAITLGRETAQSIERRTRALLLETSLTRGQQDRIDRILQSAQDLLCALQAARYAWQMALLLPEEGPSGQMALPRLRRVSECVIEMSSRVALAIEGREEAAAAVAEQYRAFLLVKEETSVHLFQLRENGTLSQTARRLVRAALWSITVSAESMAKVAARFALPIETSRQVNQDHEKYKHLDRGDDLLAPLRRR